MSLKIKMGGRIGLARGLERRRHIVPSENVVEEVELAPWPAVGLVDHDPLMHLAAEMSDDSPDVGLQDGRQFVRREWASDDPAAHAEWARRVNERMAADRETVGLGKGHLPIGDRKIKLTGQRLHVVGPVDPPINRHAVEIGQHPVLPRRGGIVQGACDASGQLGSQFEYRRLRPARAG